MESSIGQATFDQAQAFKKSVAIGAVIIIFKYNLQGQQSGQDLSGLFIFSFFFFSETLIDILFSMYTATFHYY